MRRTSKILLIIATIASIHGQQSYAQVSIEEQNKSTELEREQQRILNERKQLQPLRSQPQKPADYDVPAEAQAPQPPPEIEDRSCLVIKRFIFYGADELSEWTREGLTKPYKGQCLTVDEMNKLVESINQHYIDKGMATTRAVLKVPQHLTKNGILEIRVIEGRIGATDISPDSWRNSTQYKIAFPMAQGDVLSLRDIDQGMAQINRLQSQRPNIDIKSGVSAGYSRLTFTNKPQGVTRIRVNRTNGGSESTGHLIDTIDLEQHSLLGLNERIFYSHTQGYPYDSDKRFTKTDTAGFDIGFGYWLLYFDYASTEYLTVIQASNAEIESSGTNINRNLKLTRTVWRNKTNVVNTQLGLSTIDKKNYVEETLVEVSSRKLSHGSLQIDWQHYYSQGSFSTTLIHSKGFELLDANRDPDNRLDYEPAAQDSLYRLNFSLNHVFDSASKLRYLGEIRSQYAETELYGERQFSVAGVSSVRGYDKQSLSEEKGGLIRNTIKINPFLLGEKRDFIADNLSFGGFYDTGWAASVYNGDAQQLRGYGWLLGWSNRLIQIDYTYGLGVDLPQGYKVKEGWTGRFSLTANLAIF